MAKLFCSPCFPSLSWQPVNGLDEALGSVSGLCWIYSYSSYLTLLLPSTYPVSLNFRGTQYSWDMLLELLVFRTVGSSEGRRWGKFFFCGFTVIIRERATRTSENQNLQCKKTHDAITALFVQTTITFSQSSQSRSHCLPSPLSPPSASSTQMHSHDSWEM